MMPRGGKRAGSGRMQARFTLDRERARRVRELAQRTGATPEQIVTAAIDAYSPVAGAGASAAWMLANETPGGNTDAPSTGAPCV